MKIKLEKSDKEKMIGIRVSKEMFEKIKKFASDQKVSQGVIVRAILEQVIDDVEF